MSGKKKEKKYMPLHVMMVSVDEAAVVTGERGKHTQQQI